MKDLPIAGRDTNRTENTWRGPIDTEPTTEALRRLVRQADADPAATVEEAGVFLGTATTDELTTPEQGLAAWALALALRHLRRLDEARTWIEAAVQRFPAGTPDHTETVLTLTGVLAFQGELTEAAALLDDLDAPEELQARVAYQRGAVAMRQGEATTAEKAYRRALDRFKTSDDLLGEAHALVGLGLVAIERSEPQEALARFGLALALYQDLELPLLAAVARNNLGHAATRAGELAAAMHHLERAAKDLEAMGEPFAEVALDRADALLSAGLAHEAGEQILAILPVLTEAGATTDRAEALLGLARVLSTSGEYEAGREVLDAARGAFEQQARRGWVDLTELRAVEMTLADGNDDRPLTDAQIKALESLSTRLRSDHTEAADDADRALANNPDSRAPSRRAAAERLRHSPDRVKSLIGTAIAHGGADDPRKAIRFILDAFAELRRRQQDVLTMDLRAGLAKQFEDLWHLGIGSAIECRSAKSLFDVVAAGTGGGAQSPPVTSERLDPAIARALRQQETSSEEWRRLLALHRSAAPPADRPQLPELVQIEALIEALGPSQLIAFVEHRQMVVAVLVSANGPQLVDPFPAAPLLKAARRWGDELRRSLRGATKSTTRLASLLEALRSACPVVAHIPERPHAVIVPTGRLRQVPWNLLVACPARISPDLLVQPTEQRRGGIALVSGPGLRSSNEEIDQIAAVWADGNHSYGAPMALTGGQASIERTLEAAGQASLLHICSHGTFDRANPLLSAYQLADGLLSGYEVERLRPGPATVVAAACDVGKQADSSTGEAVGLPIAWLAAGTQTVVAPGAVLPDDMSTADIMVDLHRGLAAGRSAEEVLHSLRLADDAPAGAALSVFGRVLSP